MDGSSADLRLLSCLVVVGPGLERFLLMSWTHNVGVVVVSLPLGLARDSVIFLSQSLRRSYPTPVPPRVILICGGGAALSGCGDTKGLSKGVIRTAVEFHLTSSNH